MSDNKISNYIAGLKAYINRFFEEKLGSMAKPKSSDLMDMESSMAEACVPREKANYCFGARTKNDIENIFKQMDISFSERLFMFIDNSGMKDSEVYNAANISKQVFHKIRTNKHYHPKKTTVFALAIGLKLDVEETKELLDYAGYSMVKNDKLDLAVRYFIEKGEYDIMVINEVLYDFDLPILGSN